MKFASAGAISIFGDKHNGCLKVKFYSGFSACLLRHILEMIPV
jgi:hypothetical protein